MNTRRKTARSVGFEIVNVGGTPQGNRNVLQVQVVANKQVPVNPPAMMNGEVSVVLLQTA